MEKVWLKSTKNTNLGKDTVHLIGLTARIFCYRNSPFLFPLLSSFMIRNQNSFVHWWIERLEIASAWDMPNSRTRSAKLAARHDHWSSPIALKNPSFTNCCKISRCSDGFDACRWEKWRLIDFFSFSFLVWIWDDPITLSLSWMHFGSRSDRPARMCQGVLPIRNPVAIYCDRLSSSRKYLYAKTRLKKDEGLNLGNGFEGKL